MKIQRVSSASSFPSGASSARWGQLSSQTFSGAISPFFSSLSILHPSYLVLSPSASYRVISGRKSYLVVDLLPSVRPPPPSSTKFISTCCSPPLHFVLSSKTLRYSICKIKTPGQINSRLLAACDPKSSGRLQSFRGLSCTQPISTLPSPVVVVAAAYQTHLGAGSTATRPQSISRRLAS